MPTKLPVLLEFRLAGERPSTPVDGNDSLGVAFTVVQPHPDAVFAK